MKNLRIKIIGAGPTGSLLAISLAKIGCNVMIFDNKTSEQLSSRTHSYAITHSSYNLLVKLDLWKLLETKINSFNKLCVIDEGIKKKLNLNHMDLGISQRESGSIGWIIDHSVLMKTLISKLQTTKNINVKFNYSANSNLESYDYVIAADGINSKSRDFYGIKGFKFKYKQSCLTSKVLIRNSNSTTAYEILREEGPFAILPMGRNIYQLVWSSSTGKCNDRIILSKSNLLDRISTILPTGYEPDVILEEPIVFNNYFYLAKSFFSKRFILVGEAAHSFHPVGGQGLNLCWRDVYSLSQLIKISANNRYLIRHLPFIYFLIRLPDVLLVAFTTHSLVAIFSTSFAPLLIIRRLTFKLLSLSKSLRKALLAIMTNSLHNIK
ncbi:FAD-dependent monooxygenase [Prochlorococcus sp. MIT 1223]|uniref:FAD-dependent monooxygenase n=1 Tax=Prochlorococcus sp. MIT 1223 TaxID=3096217 RepID=UPI002A758AAA|nr:FAD-dependent monooxygenase [Prochlorococcus sp. MIT 1223]